MPKKQAITHQEYLPQLYLEAGLTQDSVVDKEFRNRILFLLFVDNWKSTCGKVIRTSDDWRAIKIAPQFHIPEQSVWMGLLWSGNFTKPKSNEK